MTAMIDLSNHLLDFQEAVIVERQQNGREESSAGVTSMIGCAARRIVKSEIANARIQ
jgi:hypothetical protein